MVKRKLLFSVMSYTGFMVEVTQCENARLPVQINVEEALLARVFFTWYFPWGNVLRFPFLNPLFPSFNKLHCYWYMPAKNVGPYT